MSKERLEEIPYNVRTTNHGEAVIDSKEYQFLYQYAIEQAERVQELEEDYEYLSHHYGLETEQNKRYREKLEHIANKPIEQGTWTTQGIDCVLTARQALEGDPK